MNIDEAKRKYVHRFTMEHVPAWALNPAPNGKYYAPHYATDQEWFENTTFPTHHWARYCQSSGQTWPLGHWLDAPYKKGAL